MTNWVWRQPGSWISGKETITSAGNPEPALVEGYSLMLCCCSIYLYTNIVQKVTLVRIYTWVKINQYLTTAKHKRKNVSTCILECTVFLLGTISYWYLLKLARCWLMPGWWWFVKPHWRKFLTYTHILVYHILWTTKTSQAQQCEQIS